MDETSGKFDGGGRFDGVMVLLIVVFLSVGDGGMLLSDVLFECMMFKLEI